MVQSWCKAGWPVKWPATNVRYQRGRRREAVIARRVAVLETIVALARRRDSIGFASFAEICAATEDSWWDGVAGALDWLHEAGLISYGDRTYRSPPRQYWLTDRGKDVLDMLRAAYGSGRDDSDEMTRQMRAIGSDWPPPRRRP